MSNQPYVPYVQNQSQRQKPQQQTSQQPYDPYAAYGAPPASSSSYGSRQNQTTLPNFSQALDHPPPSRPAQVATTAPGSINQPSSSSAYSTNSNRAGGFSSLLGGGGKLPNSLTGLASSFGGSGGGSSVTPTAPAATYGNNPPAQQPNYYNDTPVSTATAIATPSSSTAYSGGPTHGLVSEGNPSKCHKVDYEIKGSEMQLVEIELDPQETVIAEAGAMMFIEEGIEFKAKFGDGSEPNQKFWGKLLAAGGRLLSGESLFVTHFCNKGHGKARVAFAAPYPGNIIPINMMELPSQKLICQKDAFLCAAKGTKLSLYFSRKIGSGLLGGEGFIMQKLEGDGMAFLHAGGTIIRRELRGEKLRLDTGCLVAFTEGIDFDIQVAPGLKTMIFGGEGIVLATLKGHGTVWMQSLPFSRMADRIVQSAPSIGGRRKGEGSMLTGNLGGLLDGDGF